MIVPMSHYDLHLAGASENWSFARISLMTFTRAGPPTPSKS